MSSPRDVYRDDGFRVFRDLISLTEAAHFAAELGRISGLQANANSAVRAGQRLAFYRHGGVAANPSLWPLLMHPHIIAAVAEVLDASPKCLPGIDTIGKHASETNAHRDASPSELLDLVVAPGDVIGSVGANGAGKSTLLRILAGLEPPEHGDMQRHPPTAAVGYLPQEPERRPGETVRAFLA